MSLQSYIGEKFGECSILSYLLCIVLISRSNQLNLCLVKRTNLKKLDTTKAKQSTKLFFDVEIVIIYEWKWEMRMLEILQLFWTTPFFLFKMKPHKKKVICFMPYICNMLTKCSLGPLPTQFDRSLISKLFQMMPFRLHCSWIISKTHTATLELGSSFWLIP